MKPMKINSIDLKRILDLPFLTAAARWLTKMVVKIIASLCQRPQQIGL
jgi:hypothetical protein